MLRNRSCEKCHSRLDFPLVSLLFDWHLCLKNDNEKSDEMYAILTVPIIYFLGFISALIEVIRIIYRIPKSVTMTELQEGWGRVAPALCVIVLKAVWNSGSSNTWRTHPSIYFKSDAQLNRLFQKWFSQNKVLFWQVDSWSWQHT